MTSREKRVEDALANMTEDEIYDKQVFAEDNMKLCKNYQKSIKVGGDLDNLRGQVAQIYWECVILCENMDQFENYFHKTASLEIPVYQVTHNPMISMPTDLARYSRSLHAIKLRYKEEMEREPSVESLRNYKPFRELATRSGVGMKRLEKLYFIQEGHWSLDYKIYEDDDSLITQGDLTEDPKHQQSDLDFKLDLDAFLETIDEKHAESLRMWMDFYTVQETAQKLGVSDQSVRNWWEKYKPRIQELRHNGV